MDEPVRELLLEQVGFALPGQVAAQADHFGTRGAGNPYLGAIYESVHSAVLSYQFKGWVDSESVPPWLRGTGPERHWALHEPIARALIARDTPAAHAAVLGHHRMMVEHMIRR